MSSHNDETENTTTLNLDFRRRSDGKRFVLPTLRVVAGPDMLRYCSIYPDEEISIGRDATCELTLQDASVSRNHATVWSDHGGNLFLRDLKSTNGTALNGEPVTGDEALPIHVADHVEIGGVTLRVDRLSMDELAHLAKVVERLDLAHKDPLTGLVTRRFIDEELSGMLMRHQHTDVPISAVFLDVDNFKRVNDVHGHAVGDDVLRSVGRLLALSVRDADICVRYGGEELLAILPNCDEIGGEQMAERVRVAIQEHNWDHYAEGLKVTASLGIAQHHEEESMRDWIDRADKALFAAKDAGRNKVISSSAL